MAGKNELLTSIFFLFCGMAAGILILLSVAIWDYGFSSPAVEGRDVVVYIPVGVRMREIGHILASENLLQDDFRFVLLARLMGVAHRLQAGEYLLKESMPPYEMLKILASGKTYKRVVTIPEGTTIFGIADILAAEKLIDRETFLKLCRDPSFLKQLNVSAASLEGYLFPDTYYFSRGAVPEKIAGIMVERADSVWRDLQGDRYAGDLSRHEVITLASIVEKETGVDRERPLVARVFLERLKRGMLLQADPTVVYGRGNFEQRLRRADLMADQPYNTYLHKGLPPGPIANPGRLALQSVLQPSDEVFLYFVSKNDGTHYFSKDLREHNRAVRKYQKSDSSQQ